jgi:hypothetical protein
MAFSVRRLRWGRSFLNPFRLAAEGFPDETKSSAQSAIIVAGTQQPAAIC